MRIGDLLRNLDWWTVLIAAAISAVGVLFIHSTTVDDALFGDQAARQTLFLAFAAATAVGVVLVPYGRFRRSAWVIYALVVIALLGLPLFGSLRNGARRWYTVFGFGIQPSEFAKLGVIIALAAWLRFRNKARTFDGLVVPVLITAVPVLLVFRQPDLGSSLVFWPILLAMCYAAGTPARRLGGLVALGAIGLVISWFVLLHDYQQSRVEVWWQHFSWDREAVAVDPDVRSVLRDAGYQPWQSLIAIGSGGAFGQGYLSGPQNRFDFLPYRSGDYVFAIVAEEVGWIGASGLILLQFALVASLFGIAYRTRERFGRLIAVGVATWIGTQSLLHVAVCAWLVPATGLPMPLVSYGGSSTLAAALGIALALSVGARREPVLASDGYD